MMKQFCIAAQFLTRLPMPSFTVSDQMFTASIRWFPAVGLLIGALVAAAAWAGALVDGWTGALAALAAWVLVTGALHLDGLADMADASGAIHKDARKDARKDTARLRAVLADPYLGSFGVTAIALQLIGKLVLVHGLLDRGLVLALVLVPFAARIGPLVWARFLPPLHDGLGARFAGAVRAADLALWGLALGMAAWAFPALLVALPAAALWAWWIVRRIGGISGDGHGAGIELVETALLAALLAAAAP